jgi:diaminopimelate decarboxylase
LEYFPYYQKKLHCEGVPVAEIARKVGTPAYIYSQSAIVERYREFARAFSPIPHLICYAVKANSNLAVLTLLRRLGAGFDIVSGGEMLRALEAGAEPGKIVFSGVGKTEQEIDLGLRHGILQFNIESEAELEALHERAARIGRIARIGLRVNPDVYAETHPYHSTGLLEHKFGIPFDRALDLSRKATRSRYLKIAGIGFHVGSQITRLTPFVDALKRLKRLLLDLRSHGIAVGHLDLGGGLGITYKDEAPPEPRAYGEALMGLVRDLGCSLLLEPGRAIVGNAGILLTRVLRIKRSDGKNFIIVDAAMNDLIRPSLYGAYHRVQPATLSRRRRLTYDVVGPVCETGDFLARDRQLASARPDELLAVMSAGAYGFVSASNYNSRTRGAEVLVRGQRFKVIRRRERFADIIRGESLRPL